MFPPICGVIGARVSMFCLVSCVYFGTLVTPKGEMGSWRVPLVVCGAYWLPLDGSYDA